MNAIMALSRILALFSCRARQRRIAIAILLALGIATMAVALVDTKGLSSLKTGDFPAFYSLAVITKSGNHVLLYDINTQRRIQNEVWPDAGDGVLPAAYPPYVAYMIQPVAVLGPVWGKVTWTTMSLAIFFVSIMLLSSIRPALRGYTLELSAGLLLFSPVLIGVMGGQLLAVSMLIYAFILRLDQVRSTRSELLLGVVIGAWLFKPQYGLIASAIPLLQGRWVVVAGFSLISIILYGIGAQVMGAFWIRDWLSFAHAFAEMNFLSNASQMPNVVGGAIASMSWFEMPSRMQVIIRAAALGLCLVLLIYVLKTAWQDRRRPQLACRAFLLLGPFLAFATPQSNFYDLGLAVVPLVLLSQANLFDLLFLALPLICAANLATALRLPWLPLFVFIAGTIFILVARRVKRLSSAL